MRGKRTHQFAFCHIVVPGISKLRIFLLSVEKMKQQRAVLCASTHYRSCGISGFCLIEIASRQSILSLFIRIAYSPSCCPSRDAVYVEDCLPTQAEQILGNEELEPLPVLHWFLHRSPREAGSRPGILLRPLPRRGREMGILRGKPCDHIYGRASSIRMKYDLMNINGDHVMKKI